MSDHDSTVTKQTGKATETAPTTKKWGLVKLLVVIITALVIIIGCLVYTIVERMKEGPTYDKVARANGLDSSQEFNVALGQNGVLTGYAANTLVIWEDRRGDTVAAALILPDGKIIPSIIVSKAVIVLKQTEGDNAQARFRLEDGLTNQPDEQATISGLVYYGTQTLTITVNPAVLNRIAPVVS